MRNEIINNLSNNKTELNDLLEAHLQKIEKVGIFHDAFQKCVVNGNLAFSMTWSWYAFFGGCFYFFYRKIYTVGLAVLLLNVFLPLFFIICIVSGATAKYFYIKKFINDLDIAGYGERPLDEVKSNLQRLGGYNTWAVAVYFLLLCLIVIGGIMATVMFGMFFMFHPMHM